MLERRRPLTARIGIFAIGHKTYWDQFDGLLDTLMGYHAKFASLLGNQGVEVIDFGMIDTSDKAFAVAEVMQAAGLDLVMCNMVTYATSKVFVPIIRQMQVPVVLVALQPLSAMDYSKADTRMQLENDNLCSVPEFTGVAIRMGRRVQDVIFGRLHNDKEAEAEIARWCAIARVLRGLKGARIGLMGHVLESMYDMHTDPAVVARTFGVHVAQLEIDQIVELYGEVTDAQTDAYAARILDVFDTPDPVSDPLTERLTQHDLRESARVGVALEEFIKLNRLTGLAYYYEGSEGSIVRHIASTLIVGNSLLIAEGFPMCGEFDLKTCVAMMILDRLDIGGSFAELHPMDFDEDFVLIGHDGPHHLRIAQGKPVLRSLKKYHGKSGRGASVEFNLKEGPITMLGISHGEDGALRFIIGEGESRRGPIPATGNTNTRGFFAPTTKDFIKRWVLEGPTHHYALGIGHHAETLQKLARVLGVDSVIVR